MKGKYAERKVVNFLNEIGYTAHLISNSKPFDAIAFDDNYVYVIEVKGVGTKRIEKTYRTDRDFIRTYANKCVIPLLIIYFHGSILTFNVITGKIVSRMSKIKKSHQEEINRWLRLRYNEYQKGN